ncbi:MAG: DUF1552 domain-containing protein [Lacipirellulaceae bacterium]
MTNESLRNQVEISRRFILKTASAAVSLPLLDQLLSPAFAKPTVSASPRRLIYLYFPNGVAEGTWHPKKVGHDGKLLELNSWMSPLEPFKDDLTIPTNLWMPEGDGHVEGPPNWLTGKGYVGEHSRAAGVSVDQVAAEAIGDQTLLPSLELSLQGQGFFSNSLPRNAISWNRQGVPLPREVEPRAVFDRMFRPPSGGATTAGVLDEVRDQARRLRKQVSRQDQHRIDEYFQSIRALEKRIEFANRRSHEMSADQTLTDMFTPPAPGIPAEHEEYVRQMLDLIVLALQSDATRVVTFMLDHGQSNRYFNFIDGVKGTWHALSHYRDASGRTDDDDGKTRWRSTKEKRAMYAKVNRWHHRQLAYLLAKLKSIQEPDGRTLLDNSLIVYGSSLGDGDTHGNEDLPTLIAGRGGGTIEAGSQIRSRRPVDMASLHLTMLQSTGINARRFGTANRPLSLS